MWNMFQQTLAAEFISNLWDSLNDLKTKRKRERKKVKQLSFILIYYLLGIIFLCGGWGIGCQVGKFVCVCIACGRCVSMCVCV